MVYYLLILQDAAVLLEQFGVVLSGVLDTQLIYGLSAFAGAASASCTVSSTPGATTAARVGAGQASKTAGGIGSVARRIGLADLFELHGFDHPRKKAMHDKDPR